MTIIACVCVIFACTPVYRGQPRDLELRRMASGQISDATSANESTSVRRARYKSTLGLGCYYRFAHYPCRTNTNHHHSIVATVMHPDVSQRSPLPSACYRVARIFALVVRNSIITIAQTSSHTYVRAYFPHNVWHRARLVQSHTYTQSR